MTELPRSAPLGTTPAIPGVRVWSTVAALLATFGVNVRHRWRERRDRRRLAGEWLVVEVKTWESARRR